jgi:hypothetical protein
VKKLIALFLAVVFISAGLVGCGGSDTKSTGGTGGAKPGAGGPAAPGGGGAPEKK